MINDELSQNCGGCLTASDLKKTYGRAYTPQELGEILKLDRRTVVKYADYWGGVEVTPGNWRFFENRIVEVLNAEQGYEKRHSTIPGKRDGSGTDASEAVSGREQKVVSGGTGMGKRNKKRAGAEAIPDKFGVFGDRSMVQ